MSLILDALHRSDQERHIQNTVPGLRTRHGEATLSESGPRLRLLGFVILLLAVLLLWVLRSGSPQESASRSSTSVSAGVPAVGVPVVSVLPSGPAPAKVTGAAPPAVSRDLTPGAPEPARADNPVPEPVLSDGVAELYQRAAIPAAAPDSPASAPVAAAHEPLPVDTIVAAAKLELAAPPPDIDPTPLVQELPQRTKDEIPSIFFSSHSWSSKASEKLVTLNGEVRREGDAVSPGVRLIKILPESIVLDFRGTRFRLRALNSWVNL